MRISLFDVNFVTLLTQEDNMNSNMNKLSKRAEGALDLLLCFFIGGGLAAALVAWWSS
jgi:hypothetical protein